MNILTRISFFTAITILTSAVSFLLLPILTQYLTPEDYGVLAIFNATTRFIVSILALGSANILMIHLINLKAKEFSSYLNSFLKLILISATFFSLLMILYILIFKDFFGLPNWLAILIPSVSFLIVIFESATTITMFTKQYKEYASLALSKFFIETLTSLFLIVGVGLNWIGRIEGLITGIIISIIITYKFLRNNNYLSEKATKNKVIQLAKQGSPLLFMTVSITVMNLSDRFFIEHYVGLADTGIYNIGAVVGGIELIFVNATISVFRPMIYTFLKEKKNDLKIQLLNILILIVTIILLHLFTDLIFDLLIDKKYYSAKPYVLPISLGFFFWGISNFYLSYLLYHKKNKLNAFVSIFSMILNLILNYFFIKEYNTIGAAYATAITYFISAIFIFLLFITNKLNAKTT